MNPSLARRLAAIAFVLLPPLVVFVPGLGYPFLSLDDVHHVALNPAIRDLSWDGIRFLFLEDTRDLRYFPMSYLSLAVDYRLFGLDVRGYHATNLLLHLANTLLVVALVRRTFHDDVLALATGALFGVHPLQVESVAWVISRRNVLFLFFFLCSAHAYLAAVERMARRRAAAWLGLVASALLYTLACLSKTAAISLPAALFLLDHAREPGPFRLAPFLRRHLPTKLPHLAAAAFVVWAGRVRAVPNPFRTDFGYTPFEWLVIVGHNFFFYVEKTLLPLRLGVFYELPEAGKLPLHYFVFAALAVALGAVTAWSAWRGWRRVFFGLAWYFVTIAPLAAFAAFFSDIPIVAADRHYYQSAIGILLVPAALFSAAWERRAGARPVLAAAAVGVLVALAGLASAHRRDWRSTIALYEALLASHPTDEFGYRLALEYADAGRMDAAFRALDAADRAPRRIFFMNFLYYRMRLAALHVRRGDWAAAADQIEAGIEATPNAFEPRDARTPLAFLYLADLRERAGDPAGAGRARARAAAAKPDPEHGFERTWIAQMPSEAQRFLEARIAAHPEEGMSWYYAGLLAHLGGDEETARRRLERAAALGYRP